MELSTLHRQRIHRVFVKVGDKVEVGQVVGIVEAMKLMNEIESECAGTVAEVLVEKWRTGRIRPAAF